uniref:Uncharacterized protein n=1 Tax=Candidatus Kentrum sp. LFY TaxID=2126342 RepID=A0A450WBY2_9GAMM|nr:MAG: hypothetical protein BECKLFY1418C_GA0070996_100942 [Candidatus Kentron sp. LFY]
MCQGRRLVINQCVLIRAKGLYISRPIISFKGAGGEKNHKDSETSIIGILMLRACSISCCIPGECATPANTHTSSQAAIKISPQRMPVSLAFGSLSSRNSGYIRCGANGAWPLSMALRHKAPALALFWVTSPAKGLQIKIRFIAIFRKKSPPEGRVTTNRSVTIP